MSGNTDPLSLGIDIGGTSIKAVVMEGEREVWGGRSGEYARPERGELREALAGVVRSVPRELIGTVAVVGVCAPGMRDEGGVIVRAVNVPGLEGALVTGLMRELLRESGGSDGVCAREFTDAHAAAVDWWRWHTPPGKGRLLALSLGTGVGACVLDEGEGGMPVPLIVTGGGPGHLGQMDVGEMGEEKAPRHPPEASRHQVGNTLESYIGLPALRAEYGNDLLRWMKAPGSESRATRALVRAVRVAHAIYRPQRVVLLGGVGIRLGAVVGEIRAAVAEGLTELAREGWTLEVGETDFHAARGAAWMAGRGS